MKSTRDRILQTLLNHSQATINDLAKSVGINAISVRHHLTSLQAEGLVAAEEQRHGVGRPRLVYFLTEKGVERFPTRYLRLTNQILEHLKETLPKTAIKSLFSEIANRMAAEFAQKGKALSLEERLNLLKESLSQEGFSIQWEKTEDHYLIREMNCPYLYISQQHPEVCLLDQTFISTVLAYPVEKVECVLKGDGCCAYSINASAPKG
ncbi:MAG: ArsR family transcriptional regulator [Anaerolineae bacterium]|nr:ArsR family transcriptional regulator [Anaerolineae bacterium]